MNMVLIGASAGGINAIKEVIAKLPRDLGAAIVIVQHINTESEDQSGYYETISNQPVKEAQDKEAIQSDLTYFAPPGYHLLIERDLTFSLSMDDPVQYARPSIDVLFESAAIALGPKVIGVLLTGANHDGAFGLSQIEERGGKTIIQNPDTAEFGSMPLAGVRETKKSHIAELANISEEILRCLNQIDR